MLKEKENMKITKPLDNILNTEAKTKILRFLCRTGAEWNGNRAGRPKGSRQKLNEDFIAALSADFEENGQEVIQKVRTESPAVYMKIVASLQPKEIDVRDKTLEDLTDSEIFDALASIRHLKAGRERAQAGKDSGQASGKAPARGELN